MHSCRFHCWHLHQRRWQQALIQRPSSCLQVRLPPGGRATSEAFTRALPPRVGSVAKSASSRTELRDNLRHELLGSGGLIAIAQAAEEAAHRRNPASLYSDKRERQRGRILPLEQWRKGIMRVAEKLRAKGTRVRGYGKRTVPNGESESDSDEEGNGVGRRKERPAEGSVGPRPALWPNAERCWQRVMPAKGTALIGWKVNAMSGEEGEDWYDGIVVRHLSGNKYIIFYPGDDEDADPHEQVELPDPTVVYHQPGPQAKATVSAEMLP